MDLQATEKLLYQAIKTAREYYCYAAYTDSNFNGNHPEFHKWEKEYELRPEFVLEKMEKEVLQRLNGLSLSEKELMLERLVNDLDGIAFAPSAISQDKSNISEDSRS